MGKCGNVNKALIITYSFIYIAGDLMASPSQEEGNNANQVALVDYKFGDPKAGEEFKRSRKSQGLK